MPILDDIFIVIWLLSIPVMAVTALISLVRIITKKERKRVKRVFWAAIVCFVASLILYILTSPSTWCEHDYTVIIDEPPTCVNEGRRERYCHLCDFTRKETFDALGHKMEPQSKREPTYETEGEFIEKCSICDYVVITKIDRLIRETKPIETTSVETKPAEPEEFKPTETQPTETIKTDKNTNDKSVDGDEKKEKDKRPSNNDSNKKTSEETSFARHTDDEAWVCAKKIVKDNLKSPSSAKFCVMADAKITHLGNGKYKVTGWVDAQNSFGAVVRENFVVTYLALPDGYKNASVSFN